MRKPTICTGENKATDQLCNNSTADQHHSFRCRNITILLLNSEISSFEPASVTVHVGFCQTWLEPKLLVFSHTGPFDFFISKVTQIKQY